MKNRLIREIGAHAESLVSVAPEETEELLQKRQQVIDSQDLEATIKELNLEKYVSWMRELG